MAVYTLGPGTLTVYRNGVPLIVGKVKSFEFETVEAPVEDLRPETLLQLQAHVVAPEPAPVEPESPVHGKEV